MRIRNILVYPGDSEIGLEIYKSLRFIKDIELYSIGDKLIDPNLIFYRDHAVINHIDEGNWIYSLNSFINKNSIDLIFPAIKEIHLKLLLNKEKIDAGIISSPLKTINILQSKSKIKQAFENTIPLRVELNNKANVIKKPEKRYIINCFSDREKKILFCKGINLYHIKEEYPSKFKLLSEIFFFEFANKISNVLEFFGPWSFELTIDNKGNCEIDKIKVGLNLSMKINRLLGINFPLLSIYEYEREDYEILEYLINKEIKKIHDNDYRILISYDVVYVDFDDTIIFKNKINSHLMRFLYQCVNENKKIILITKHRDNIYSSLDKFKVSRKIFQEIIHLKMEENKSHHIKEKSAILIDDSYKERKEVSEKSKIPAFDLSMIESLIYEDY